VHLDQGILTLPQTKTGPAVVMLNEKARERSSAHIRASGFFRTRRPGAHTAGTTPARCGGRGQRRQPSPTSTSTTCGTTGPPWLNAGFSGAIVQELGRWKSERMMRRYAAVASQTLRAAAEAVSGMAGGIGSHAVQR
jgi:hypothetical protein